MTLRKRTGSRRQRYGGSGQWLCIAAVAMLIAAAARPAAAQQRPLTVEDPETIGAGRVLVEGGVDFLRGVEFPIYGLEGNLRRLPSIGVSVGVGPIAELQVDTGFNRLRVTGRRPAPLSPVLNFDGDETSAIEDVVLATKIRLVSEGQRRPALAVRLATKLPNARNESGLGTDMTDVAFSLLAAKTVGSIRVVGNLGLAIIGDPTQNAVQYDPAIYGVSIARALAPGVEVVGELAGRWQPYELVPPPAAEDRASMRAGLRYTYGTVRVDAGLVVGLVAIEPTLGVTAGFTWVFDAFTVP